MLDVAFRVYLGHTELSSQLTWQGIRLPFGKNMRFVRVHAVVLVVGAVVLVVGQVRFGGILCGWRVRGGHTAVSQLGSRRGRLGSLRR